MKDLLHSMEIMYLVLAAFIIGGLIFLWKVNKDPSNTLHITDLITDKGRINERKFCRFGAWVVSTWGFVYLIVDGKLSIEYFSIYISVWAANALVGKAINSKFNSQTHEDPSRDYLDYPPSKSSFISRATPIPPRGTK